MARAGALLVLTAITALALVLGLEMGQPPGAGTFPVEVLGPEDVLFDGNVTLRDATAYSALQVAAAQGGFDVESRDTPMGVFVTRVGEHTNSGNGGWCYAVWEGRWVQPGFSADQAGLQDGQAVRWSYEAEGCGALG